MDIGAEIRGGGPLDSLAAEGVCVNAEPFVNLTASAESREEGKWDQFSCFKGLFTRKKYFGATQDNNNAILHN